MNSYVVLLGVAQDGGYPQTGCRRPCCERAWNNPGLRRSIVSLAVVDSTSGRRWLIDCTPDVREQLRELDRIAPPAATSANARSLDGVLLTHAHVGHYAGLLQLGREVMATQRTPVYAMPLMRRFLETNAPWSQLVSAGNIELRDLRAGEPLALSEQLHVTPLEVPHRGEYSETVAFRVQGARRSLLYLPDIDAWESWEPPIEERLAAVDRAYLDGTFYSDSELLGRDPAEIPHPTITHSLKRFSALPPEERDKVRLLHFNHTNPVLDEQSPAARHIAAAGCHIAMQGERYEI